MSALKKKTGGLLDIVCIPIISESWNQKLELECACHGKALKYCLPILPQLHECSVIRDFALRKKAWISQSKEFVPIFFSNSGQQIP